MERRRMIAILTSVVLGIGTAPTGVLAADSYKEAEKKAFREAVESLAANYGESLENSEFEWENSSVDITIGLEDAGKALLGMLAPADVSWLGDARLSADVSVTEGMTCEQMDLYVNETKICSLEYYLDMETSDIYMRIPELADGYIKVNAKESAEQVLEEEDGVSGGRLVMNTSDTLQLISDMKDTLPDAAVLESLLNKYGTILLDGVSDEESGAETLRAGGVEQECTVLQGSISGEEAIPMFKEILSTAKEDQELKNVIENVTKSLNDEEYSYDKFLKGIEDLEEELGENTEEPGTGGIVSKIWLDEEERVAGRQISLRDETGEEETLITWKSPKLGEQCGFGLEISGDGSVISLEGSGELTGNLLNGTYTLTLDDTAIAIDVKDYDTAAMEEGILNAGYAISIVPAEEESEYNIMQGFELGADFSGDKETFDFRLSLNSSGASLIWLGISTRPGEAVEAVDVDSLEKVYDMSNEADAEAFTTDMNLETIMNNLTEAGMPEDFIENLMSAGEDTEDYYESEEDMEDSYE